jgi:hypothetical protein
MPDFQDQLRRATTKMSATFPTQGRMFAAIRGDAGYITAAGARVGLIGRWKIERAEAGPDGKPRFRFRAQFSWRNDALMGLISRGRLKGRVVLQMKTKKGVEDVDLVAWDEWRMEDGILTLENVLYSEGKVTWRPVQARR